MATEGLVDSDVVGATRDVLITPLDDQQILALLVHHVVDRVAVVALVKDMDLVDRNIRAHHTHQEDVHTCKYKYGEVDIGTPPE